MRCHLRRGRIPRSLFPVALLALGAAPVGTPAATSTEGPVVVELFTSEGCSSCPPAEAALAGLRRNPPADGPDLILLAYHVDYWDRLGWRDPFSSRQATARQLEYARRFREDPYTPQMVVDGSVQFVGSQAARIEEEIGRASRPTKARLDLQVVDVVEGGGAKIRVTVPELPEAPKDDLYEVIAILTEDGLASDVTAGENAGRRLDHAAVVRRLDVLGSMRPADAPTGFRADLKLGRDWDLGALRAIVLVQEKTTGAIVGAAERALRR